jgi:hypothetical protein
VRWVGIDEAGYGPNLGPLVMTAVIAESPNAPGQNEGDGQILDFWSDLAVTVDRAGGDPERLWVDDSKAIYCGGKGRDRLEMTCLAAVHAAENVLPGGLEDLLRILGAGSLEDTELLPWIETEQSDRTPPWMAPQTALEALLARGPLSPDRASWRVVAIRSVVVGPALFNRGLTEHGVKSAVHYVAFERLLRVVWEMAGDGALTRVLGDKHGGRHFYFRPLSQSFPDAWIDRGPEGAELSHYVLRDAGRRVELRLMPRADANDGLVALASIVSKTVRELWMDAFNAFWLARVPGLKRTAGYPGDSMRFRTAIEATAAALNHDPALWWRIK